MDTENAYGGSHVVEMFTIVGLSRVRGGCFTDQIIFIDLKMASTDPGITSFLRRRVGGLLAATARPGGATPVPSSAALPPVSALTAGYSTGVEFAASWPLAFAVALALALAAVATALAVASDAEASFAAGTPHDFPTPRSS